MFQFIWLTVCQSTMPNKLLCFWSFRFTRILDKFGSNISPYQKAPTLIWMPLSNPSFHLWKSLKKKFFGRCHIFVLVAWNLRISALWNAKSLRVTSSFTLPLHRETKRQLNIISYPLISKHSVTTSYWSRGERDGKLRLKMVSRVSRAARGRTVTRHPRRLRQSACEHCVWTADQIFLTL